MREWTSISGGRSTLADSSALLTIRFFSPVVASCSSFQRPTGLFFSSWTMAKESDMFFVIEASLWVFLFISALSFLQWSVKGKLKFLLE